MDTIASISTSPGIGGIGIIRMSGKNTFASVVYQHVVCHHRKVQKHLVYLGIAIATASHNLATQWVEHRHNSLRVVVLRNIVARPVVKYVAEYQHLVAFETFKTVKHFFTCRRASVNVGKNEYLHFVFSVNQIVSVELRQVKHSNRCLP